MDSCFMKISKLWPTHWKPTSEFSLYCCQMQ